MPVPTKKLPLVFIILTLWATMFAPPADAQKKSAPRTHHRRIRHHRASVKQGIKVWVNTNSGVYHYPGQRWYGNTREGAFMTESEAKKRGYRPTSNGQ